MRRREAGTRRRTIGRTDGTVGDDGLYVMLTAGAPGAANHLAKHAGDVAATLRNGSYSCPTRSGQ